MTYILVAENLPEEFCEKLKAYGEVVRTRANKNILKVSLLLKGVHLWQWGHL